MGTFQGLFRVLVASSDIGVIMASNIHTAADFYERHPISAQIILTKLEAARGTLDGLRPDELFPHDQDHYGGTAANDAWLSVRISALALRSSTCAPVSAARPAIWRTATAHLSPASN